VKKADGRRQLGMPRCRWRSNSKMDRINIYSNTGLSWIYSLRNRDRYLAVVGTVMKCRILQNAVKFLKTAEKPLSF
jgi:hypothetical protein